MKLPIVFVVGPTASGKSDLALRLAQEFNGAIINCDSIQMYKELNIGSAKPSQNDFLKVPHFLFNIANYPTQITAGEYLRFFEKTILELKNIDIKFLIVVGGTGFYFQALEKGMLDAGVVDPKILEEIKKQGATREGALALYNELISADPECATWIHQNDKYRIERSLGIWRTEKKKVSDLKKQEAHSGLKSQGYSILKVGVSVDKAILEERIKNRIEVMIASGFEKEVRDLLDQGVDPHWPPFQSVGYREMIQYIQSKDLKLDQLKLDILISTRQLAKKQRTWFQRDKEIIWVDSLNYEVVQKTVQQFLARE